MKNQVDLTEGRYLLSGASDASASVFDIQRATDFEGGGEGALIAKHKSLITIDKQHQNGHKFAISSAIWYTIDTGLFVTGSYDHYIKVWDTNSTQVYCASASRLSSFELDCFCYDYEVLNCCI